MFPFPLLVAVASAPVPAPAPANTFLENLIRILVGVAGCGGLTAVFKIWHNGKVKIVEADGNARVRAIVLPDGKGEGGIKADLAGIKDDIQKLQPNGGGTKNLGDVVLNMGKDVSSLKTSIESLAATTKETSRELHEHIGWVKSAGGEKQ